MDEKTDFTSMGLSKRLENDKSQTFYKTIKALGSIKLLIGEGKTRSSNEEICKWSAYVCHSHFLSSNFAH
jgi:hypothetical protein